MRAGNLGEKGVNGMEEMGGAGMGWKDEKGQRLNNWMQGSIPRNIFLDLAWSIGFWRRAQRAFSRHEGRWCSTYDDSGWVECLTWELNERWDVSI